MKRSLVLVFLLGAGLSCDAASGEQPRESYTGWQLTEDSARDRRDNAKLLLETMAAKPGMKVADMGAGAGYYAVKLASSVGRSGLVYATDISGRWVEHLERHVREKHIENLVVRKVRYGYDTGISSRNLDLIIMINSLQHDCGGDLREALRHTRKLLKLLKAGGRVIYFADRLSKDMCGKDQAIELFLAGGFSKAYRDIAIPSKPLPTPEYPVPGFFLVFTRPGA